TRKQLTAWGIRSRYQYGYGRRPAAATEMNGYLTEGSKRANREESQGSVRAVWGSLLALAFMTALNPVRLGITLLVISRPRPVPNLLAYWLGCLTGCVPAVVVPLTLLHVTPMFKSWADGLTKSSAVRHIQLGMGALVLSIAVLITVRSLIRRRQP